MKNFEMNLSTAARMLSIAGWKGIDLNEVDMESIWGDSISFSDGAGTIFQLRLEEDGTVWSRHWAEDEQPGTIPTEWEFAGEADSRFSRIYEMLVDAGAEPINPIEWWVLPCGDIHWFDDDYEVAVEDHGTTVSVCYRYAPEGTTTYGWSEWELI